MSRPTRFVTLIGGLGTLCLLIAAPVQATHPRPAGATPLRVSLVPAYVQCACAEPHAWAAACIPFVQPACADLELPDRRHARRQRRLRWLDRVRADSIHAKSVLPGAGRNDHGAVSPTFAASQARRPVGVRTPQVARITRESSR